MLSAIYGKKEDLKIIHSQRIPILSEILDEKDFEICSRMYGGDVQKNTFDTSHISYS